VLPSAIGPLLAGMVMDNADPRWVWYGAAIVGVAAAFAYTLLHRRIGQAGLTAIQKRLTVLQRLEENQITAEEAAHILEGIHDSQYARLDLPVTSRDLRYLRIKISRTNSEDQSMQTDGNERVDISID
jgi:hypothetical protein